MQHLRRPDHEVLLAEAPLLHQLGQVPEVEERREIEVDSALGECPERRVLGAGRVAEAAEEFVDPVVIGLDHRPRPGVRRDQVAQEGIRMRRHAIQRHEAHHHPVRPGLEPACIARQHGLEELDPLDRQGSVVRPGRVLVGPHVL